MSKQYHQINFTDVDQQVQTTLIENIPAVAAYWSGYAPHEQTALVDWARRKKAGEQVEKWRVCLAAANKFHRGHRPQPTDAKSIAPNKKERRKDWSKDEPILHDLIVKAAKKLHYEHVDGYRVYNSLLLPHVFNRGSWKGRHIVQPFAQQPRNGSLGPRELVMLVKLVTLCVGRQEGNELITSPIELRLNRRLKYKNRELHDSMWAAITALLATGYLSEAEPVTDRKWRIVIDRALLQSWLIDHRENHAYQIVKADEFFARARSPLRLWMYCSYQTTFDYIGKNERTVREASGSRAKPENFRRAMRELFKDWAARAALRKMPNSEIVEPTVKTEVMTEIKRRITKVARSVWIRNDVSNTGSHWQLQVGYWIRQINQISDLVFEAINHVAARIFGDPVPADA